MIREIHSFEAYEAFIGGLAEDPVYSDPHFTFDRGNLCRSVNDEDEFAFVVSENGRTEGLFVWLILPEDRYIEMIIGFTKREEAFREMLSDLERRYGGYNMDFVFNPRNPAIRKPLEEKGAAFDPEQQKMLLTGAAPKGTAGQTELRIELLSETWAEQYRALHRTETYWTAERILAAREKFRVLLAVKDGRLQGYLDVMDCDDVNEIYDLYVRPGAARQGYASALLGKAIEWNGPKQLMVVVDVDAEEEIALYAAAGFERMEGQNSLTASYRAEAT